jgi:hypothetical protein
MAFSTNTVNEGLPDAFFSSARSMIADHQNVPGFPLQFEYQEQPQHPLHSRNEYFAVNLQPSGDVPQNGERQPVIGDYHSMVEDLPWDPIHERKVKNNLTIAGFGFMAMAMMLL